MVKNLLAVFAVVLVAGTLSFLPAANNSQTWKGYVTDTWCGLDRANKPPTVACTKLCLNNRGAKYALFDVVHNKLYVLNPQTEAAKYTAQMVTVTGTLTVGAQMITSEGTVSGSTIIASSISVVPSKSN
jgi:hypothetical protein